MCDSAPADVPAARHASHTLCHSVQSRSEKEEPDNAEAPSRSANEETCTACERDICSKESPIHSKASTDESIERTVMLIERTVIPVQEYSGSDEYIVGAQ